MRRDHYFFCIFIAINFFISIGFAATSAHYYRWQDHLGVWHFSDKPPGKSAVSPRKAAQTLQLENLNTFPINVIAPYVLESSSEKTRRRWKQKSGSNENKRDKRKKLKAKEENTRRKNCKAFHVRLDRIQRKLRSGYKEPQGNRLREKRRALKNQVYRHCRAKNLKI